MDKRLTRGVNVHASQCVCLVGAYSGPFSYLDTDEATYFRSETALARARSSQRCSSQPLTAAANLLL